MKRWREEKGSALVMVMFMMLILTLLGVTILSATVAGSRRTLTRENDIQSLQLTQKVLDESVAKISSNLSARVALPSFDSKNLKIEIQNILDTIPVDPNGSPEQQSDRVKTSALHQAYGSLIERPVALDDFPSDNPLKKGTAYKFTLKASGVVNGVKRTLSQDVKVNMYPDFLQYAFGSEQDLILNGAPYINGNIYAGNDLIVTNRPEYVYNGKSLATSSLYPKMAAGGLVFIQRLDHFLSGNHRERVTPITSEGDAKVADRTKQALGVGIPQLQIKDKQKFVQINVEESFIDKLAAATGTSQSFLQKAYAEANSAASPSDRMSDVVKAVNNPALKQLKMPDPAVQKPYPAQSNPPTPEEIKALQTVIKENNMEIDRYNRELSTLKTDLSNMATTSVFTGDLELGGQTFSSIGTRNKSSWLIVNGNLTFSGDEMPQTNLSSNVLVTGSVRFKNQVEVDSTMIVMGNTTIEDASIRGKVVDGSERELVLISKGSVLLNRVDAFQPAVQKLRGFFYTDSTATLYGVGSNFWMEGGFFAKGNLTINAVVGNSQQDKDDIAFTLQSPDGTQSATSRFKVIYNDEVYAHQGQSLPQVEQVSLSVGKVELK